jgi:hypothetical protein
MQSGRGGGPCLSSLSDMGVIRVSAKEQSYRRVQVSSIELVLPRGVRDVLSGAQLLN